MGRGAYLGYLNAVNFEFSVWMWLLGVEHLLDGDGAEGVFAILRLVSGVCAQRRARKYLAASRSLLTAGLRAWREASAACAALSAI